MEKYKEMIEIINVAITRFRNYFRDPSIIPFLDYDFNNIKSFIKLMKVDCNQEYWPHSDDAGVYFLFGFSELNKNRLGLYIGKASNKSAIGYELSRYLPSKYNDSKKYPMKDKNGSVFFIELVTSIPIIKEHKHFSPALEEYLIFELKENIFLLNAIGV